jgi:signal recognition particle subunit SRP54
MALFENLGGRLGDSLRRIAGKAQLSEDNIRETLRDVRMALLEADVALPVVKEFIDRVRSRALGMQIGKGLNPGQQFLKLVQDELVHLMGDANSGLNLAVRPPAVILMAGLQGAGKTTSVAKLARYLVEREKKKVLVVSADVYRPAAIQQLATLAQEVGVGCVASSAAESPLAIAERAVTEARRGFADVLIVDTAGRLHIDAELMDEIRALSAALNPAETLFVIDAMIGQDAVNTARAFNEALPLTGVILTKVDGDARGGAALSVRQVTGKPIKFMGVGEKTDALEPFHPERIASRILGMGDVLSLIEEVERKVDRAKAEKLARKVEKGKTFDLEDLRDQLQQMQNLGGMTGLLDKLPGMGNMAKMVEQNNVTAQFRTMQVIIDSMTPAERADPEILNGSRKRRITQGSGTSIQDLNRLLKQHKQMAKTMKKMKGKNLGRMMRGLEGMLGGQGIPR